MRRARIKAVATVPVRRKAAQDGATAESVGQTDAKEAEKPPEIKNEEKSEKTVQKSVVEKPKVNDEIKIENTRDTIQTNHVEEVAVPKVPEKPPASPVKETESLIDKSLNDKVPEINDKPEQKTSVQLAPKSESLQKTIAAEGIYIF